MLIPVSSRPLSTPPTLLGPVPSLAAPALPLLLARAACGFPSPAEDFFQEDDRLDLNERLIANPPATFLMDLIRAEDRQADLFFRPNEKAERGMAVLDKINAKFGRGTVGVGTGGWRVGGAKPSDPRLGSKDAQWRPELQALSPGYTTRWNDWLLVR